MNPSLFPELAHHASAASVAATVEMGVSVAGALLLGILVGYERSYQGRAAGMRTYGLVCMGSAALTMLVGYPSLWYGGSVTPVDPDPTRVVQGVVTGVGFLCAGVIVRDGLSISGLTTAASIWVVSAIGVLLGVGFHGAALVLAVLCVLSMSVLRRVEARLPGRATLDLSLTFDTGGPPDFESLARDAEARGYRIVRESLMITFNDKRPEWRFSLVALNRFRAVSPTALAAEMAATAGVTRFSLVPVRH